MLTRRRTTVGRFVVACIISAFIFFVCYISLDLSVRRMEDNVRAEVKMSDTPTDISSLLESKFRSPIGDVVFLNEVRIEPGPSIHLFFAADQQGNKIMIRWDTAATNLLNGKLADVTGVIKRLPSLAAMEREWNLGRSVATDLPKEAIYIHADRIWPASAVTPANPAQNSNF